MKFFKYAMLIFMSWGVISCDMTELDLLENPNAVTPENASVNDLYNNVQLTFRNLYNSAQDNPGGLARMYTLIGSFNYQGNTSPNTSNGLWYNAYSALFPDIDQALLPIAEANGFDIHAGSAKIMKAYTLMVLVDLLNNVPFTEAGQGTDIISPVADPGEQVYDAALALLDEAIADLQDTDAPAPATDIFYNGDPDLWIKAAKTLKLRAALTTRLVNGSESATIINNLVSEGDIITEASEDFQFNYGNQRNNPNSRHPFYQNHYEVGDGDYLSNYYMWLLRADKEDDNGNAIVDPRIRFYFYRKVDDAVNQDATTYSCHFSTLPDQSAKPDHWAQITGDSRIPYCVASEDGYSGRDHMNGEGIPPDGPIRTSYGLYPGGGQFDDDTFEDTRQNGTTGGLGQGILPVMLSSFVDFMRAEAALTLGTNDDAATMLESGIRASIDKVFGFKSLVPGTMSRQVTLRDGSEGTVEQLYVPSQDRIEAYVDHVMNKYNSASSDEERLDIIIKEYYIAAWGNGLEAYNMYRRTGKPANMQPGLEPEVGAFASRLFLPADHVNRNANATQVEISDRVFWDDGSADVY